MAPPRRSPPCALGAGTRRVAHGQRRPRPRRRRLQRSLPPPPPSRPPASLAPSPGSPEPPHHVARRRPPVCARYRGRALHHRLGGWAGEASRAHPRWALQAPGAPGPDWPRAPPPCHFGVRRTWMRIPPPASARTREVTLSESLKRSQVQSLYLQDEENFPAAFIGFGGDGDNGIKKTQISFLILGVVCALLLAMSSPKTIQVIPDQEAKTKPAGSPKRS